MAFFSYAWQSLKVAIIVSLASIILATLIVFYQRVAKQGYSFSDPKFWDKGLSMISSMIDELEAME